jgi:hypothetical protein
MSDGNTIPQDQGATKQLERLAAQRHLFSFAKKIQAAQIILAVPGAVAWSLLVLWRAEVRPYAALWGVAAALFDALILTRWQVGVREEAAKIQELFDCDVLRMAWPELKAGHRPDPETIQEHVAKYKRRDAGYAMLRGWYPAAVGQLPLHLARLVCQRTNCRWDANLRRRYAQGVIAAVAILTLVVFLIGIIRGVTLASLLLGVVAPLLPAFVLGARQYTEHTDAAARLDRLKEHSEDLWRQSLAGELSPEEVTRASRMLQDEIFDNRRRSPLILDWLYRRFKRSDEERMNIGAEALVEEAMG